MKSCALVLHNIRSAHNVGSLFRTADGAGVEKIILSGYSPTPLDQYGGVRKDIHKVALGAEETVPWERIEDPHEALRQLKQEGYFIIALELDERAVSLYEFKTHEQKIALLLGNEVKGVLPSLIEQCDALVQIPMHGKKESLNVSVAGGIALFELLR